jgi:hypothetical protein
MESAKLGNESRMIMKGKICKTNYWRYRNRLYSSIVGIASLGLQFSLV